MGDYVSMTGAVLTVICILFLAYWCSRMLGKNWIRTSSCRNLKVIESFQVGMDRQLLLLELQDHIYLLGVSPAGIQLLTEVEGELKEPEAMPQGAVSAFRELLEKKKGGNQ